MGFVTRHKEKIQPVLATSQNVSVFDFREPGYSINKIKQWDNSIIIDSSKQLFNLLLKNVVLVGVQSLLCKTKDLFFTFRLTFGCFGLDAKTN
jgi:hypothetical protein